MIKTEANELRMEFLGPLALNPFKANNSASREQMVGSHLGQSLVIEGSTERYIQTGAEAEYGEYTFNVRMPEDGQIIRVIQRYARTYGEDSIQFSPQTIAIYEEEETQIVGCIDMPLYSLQHPYLGFAYKPQPAMAKLVEKASVQKDEVFLDSPSKRENGGYAPGIQLNVAFMSKNSVSEDGLEICRDVTPSIRFKKYETRSGGFGSKTMPLFTYGTKERPKIFPDIGDEIRPDGLLWATRTYDDSLSPVEQSVHDLWEVDRIFDETVYVEPGGRVVDVKVWYQPNNGQPIMPEAMEKQPMKYEVARRQFYQEILDEYNRLKRERGPYLRITPDFQELVREAISVVGKNTTAPNEAVKTLYHHAPLDEWRIEVVVEYTVTPKEGMKLTDLHGG